MRRLAASLLAVTLGAAGIVAAVGQSAAAHGAEVFPGSRQYLCWVDAVTESGALSPSNAACADALAEGGPNAYYNWFGNLDSNGAGRTEGYIPDGTICSGGDRGPYDFSAFSAARTDWPTTHLTAGATYEFQHNNWAEHPGRFDVYVTREGFDPSQPLGWSDLELVDSVTDPPDTGGPGGDNYYYWDVTLPADRTGRHIVFTHWVRSDSNENFYSCSDVAFDGGDGEVTGIDGDPGTEEPPAACPDETPGVPGAARASSITATGAHVMWGVAQDGCVTGYDVLDPATGAVLASTDGSPMVDLTGLDPGTSYDVAVRSRNDNTGAVSTATASTTFTTLTEDDGGGDAGACEVTYSAQSWGDGQRGYTASVTVTNTSDSPVANWSVAFEYPGGQTVDEPGWSATVTQSGTTVTAAAPPWSTTVAAGQSVTFGFNGATASAGQHPAPQDFTLAGAACDA
ncbi:lytic polysaccharide monooxygenase [Isoptericola sp. NEAU-Y5]|uniref:Lytic polysaccharide monooxygenase n=1 Tax=Isoptericola luteus TaxID=2879484 RepID=A0ABS7ZER7_9MICO|nr:lytic polysaccharide monooxygenase [Isoptericola sp. NEAU-Y5]MCA5893520.1 lytic polysaccharide monooxygenase [Isoptericola sp. NEAU-Y5]